MERFKSILLAASPGHLEQSIVRAAVKLAATNDADLTVLDVMAPLQPWRKKVNVEGRVIDIEAALLQDREERLRHVIELTQAGPNTKAVVAQGEPFVEVIRHVLHQGHDLVMVGAPAAERGTDTHLGSGVMHVLRKCPVPVWVMRPSVADKLRILALVDPDAEDRDHEDLDRLVMELATSLTRREGGELHVGHAWNLVGESTLRSSPYVELPGAIVDAMVRDAEDLHHDKLDELAGRYHVAELGGSIHLVSGEPSDVLPRLAERLDTGLIVMGTVGRTRLKGLIMGNTAETILRSVRCSVLAVKPEGFVTPVRPQRRQH